MFFKRKNKKLLKKEQFFKELLYWKKEFKKVMKELNKETNKKSEHSLTELNHRKTAIENMLNAAEKNMYDVEKGLYFGIGYELNNSASPKPEPIIATWENLENHVGFKGTTRVGKSFNMLTHIEQCIAKKMDVIIIDPKGGIKQEILSSLVESCVKFERAEELTYFSPAFPSISQRINVCYGLTNLELSESIVKSIKTPEMDSFYLETAGGILKAITTSFEYLQEVSDPTGEITKLLEQKELKKYHAFLNNKNKNEYDFLENFELENIDMIDEYKSDVEEDKLLIDFQENGFNRSMITFRELERYSHYDMLASLKTLVETIEIEKNTKYRKNIEALKRDSLILLNTVLSKDKIFFSKVSTTLTNRLVALSVGPIGELLCDIRINPLMNRLLRKDKGLVSLIQPFPMKFKNAADIFNKMLLGMLDSMMGTVGAEGRGLPRRVAIFIDEAGAIAYPGIEAFFNKAGGLGITAFVYTQTDEDYKSAVGETLSNIILDNVNTKGIMKQNTLSSIKNAAEEIGMFKQMKTIAMVSTAGDGDGRYTTDTVEEYLCTPQDIKALPVGEGILMHEGKAYYMEFPFRKPPVASIKMPTLDTEIEKRELVEFEKKFEKLAK